jgi:succinate dehydrogenase/fumarate reductase flavoprotein subunit
MSAQFPVSNELDADLLVLGGGMAGLTAAARAATDGARVVLVEKAPAVGGSAQYAGYVWTAESHAVLRAINPRGDAELGRVVVEGLWPGLDWIRSLGVAVQPPVVVLGYGRGCETDLSGYLTACLTVVREHGGTVLTSAQATRLLRDERGVHGAVVEVDGREVTVTAAATLLATGGFGADPDERAARIHPLARGLKVRGNPNSTGGGVRLGLEAGAAFVGDAAGFYGHLIPSGVAYEPQDYIALTFYHSEHGLLLNLGGDRYVDETLGDHLNTLATLEQPEARALLITDQRVHEQWMLTPYVEGAEAPDKFRFAYSRGARAAIAHDLDELAALPEEWGYPGAAARAAVEAFNEDAAAGAPTPGRALDCVPLIDPPYYVIEVVPAITNTWGGLAVDPDARVLDADGRPIPGLLAAGAEIGGLFDRAYGGGIAAGLTFGLRAAATAAVPAPH